MSLHLSFCGRWRPYSHRTSPERNLKEPDLTLSSKSFPRPAILALWLQIPEIQQKINYRSKPPPHYESHSPGPAILRATGCIIEVSARITIEASLQALANPQEAAYGANTHPDVKAEIETHTRRSGWGHYMHDKEMARLWTHQTETRGIAVMAVDAARLSDPFRRAFLRPDGFHPLFIGGWPWFWMVEQGTYIRSTKLCSPIDEAHRHCPNMVGIFTVPLLRYNYWT
ncbi:hypothetical protein BU16DRAFT_565886 [Lophium mytilinum]|uniref:Uncharacterized protein n=1 Tax=Lophium mytilinum TaxID=390894 RepID=A0A6A6QFL2_9PEZI|nr:hypothetical protein BU16DRAFT_565886 [Lophium mytilinum]